jgi:hypothetical protein
MIGISIRVLKMQVYITNSLLASLLAIGLAGCGYSQGDRAASGGLLGAAGGAGIAALTGGSPLAGAAIGGAAGAVGGAVTSGQSVNLGRPLWR